MSQTCTVRHQSTERSRAAVDFLHEMILDLQLHPQRGRGGLQTMCSLHEAMECTRTDSIMRQGYLPKLLRARSRELLK